MRDNYARKAKVVRVIDGDTVVLDVDLGFYLTVRMSCRLFGIDAPEVVGETRASGLASRDYLAELLPVGKAVIVDSIKPDKYAGRFDGVIYLSLDNVNVNVDERLVSAGHARLYEM